MFALSVVPKRTAASTEPSAGQLSLVLACHIISVIRQFHDRMQVCVRLDDRVFESLGFFCRNLKVEADSCKAEKSGTSR